MAQDYTTDPYNSAHVVATDMGEINNNFAALKSAFSGATTPANTVAGQWWYDTTAHILKVRNEANSAWLSVWDLANNKPVIANLSDEITGAMISSAIKDAAAGTASLRTLGTGALQACAGNDTRLSDTRMPPDYSISQTKLKTSQGNFQTGIADIATATTYSGVHTLPGGQYGFTYQLALTGTGNSADGYSWGELTTQKATLNNYSATTWITIGFRCEARSAIGSKYITGYQRYVTASGEVNWIFVLRDIETKEIDSMWQSSDHPCMGNGGKPLLRPHPFGHYNPKKHEIIVLNPSDEEIFNMQDACVVDDETKPDRDMLQVIMEDYEIDEDLQTEWPRKLVTVGLPPGIDWKRMPEGTLVTPQKKRIPKPEYITTRKLWRRK